jgi:hypothetical protein
MTTVTIPVYDFVRHESMRYTGETVVIFPLVQPTYVLGQPVSSAIKCDVEPVGQRCSLAAIPSGLMCWLRVGPAWHLVRTKE